MPYVEYPPNCHINTQRVGSCLLTLLVTRLLQFSLRSPKDRHHGPCKGIVGDFGQPVEILALQFTQQPLQSHWIYIQTSQSQKSCQQIIGHVSYPIDSPIATKLGLCNSISRYIKSYFILVVVSGIRSCLCEVLITTKTDHWSHPLSAIMSMPYWVTRLLTPSFTLHLSVCVSVGGWVIWYWGSTGNTSWFLSSVPMEYFHKGELQESWHFLWYEHKIKRHRRYIWNTNMAEGWEYYSQIKLNKIGSKATKCQFNVVKVSFFFLIVFYCPMNMGTNNTYNNNVAFNNGMINMM